MVRAFGCYTSFVLVVVCTVEGSVRVLASESQFCASWLLKTLQVKTYLVILQYGGRSSLFCTCPHSISLVFGLETGIIWGSAGIGLK